MLQGLHVYTVEALEEGGRDPEHTLHAVQEALFRHHGTQCGYCTPGFVMSLLEACYREDFADLGLRGVEEQIAGNLCRCTGYRSIREAALEIAGARPTDRFLEQTRAFVPGERALAYEAGGQLYLQPASLDGLFEALHRYPNAVIVAGGTDLGLDVNKRRRVFTCLIGLDAVEEIQGIERRAGGWEVGAGVTLTRLQEDVTLPGLQKMLRVFGSRQIRNRATLGGNLANASPIGDMAPLMLALDAYALIGGPDGRRELPMREFFVAYRRTALRAGEILLGVRWEDPPPGSFFSSYKVARRREMDISAVSAGMLVSLDDAGRVEAARVAYGGVAALPLRAAGVEALLRGRTWDETSVREAMERLGQEIQPISDPRGSAHFRLALAKNLLLGFYLESQRPDRDALPDRPTGTVLPGALSPV
jgi:xanthine dehydrogenase small subunit